MTLIAMTISDMPPIITADILTTSINGEVDMRLPNRPIPLTENEVKHLTYKPYGLVQKLYIIQPNICFCGAGNVYDLKLILEDFRNFCKWKSNEDKHWLTLEILEEFFSNYDQEIINEVILGIAVVEDKENGFVFTPEKHKSFWQGGESDDFGAILAAGSGKTQYLQHISWNKLVGSSHKPGDFMYAKQVNYTFITKLLCKENLTLKSLENYWGGFIETCYFNGECFQKDANVAIVIGDSETDNEGNMSIIIPKLFIYSQYIDNVLYLTTVQASDFEIIKSEVSITYKSKDFIKTLFIVKEIDAIDYASVITQNDNLSYITQKIALGINVKTTAQTYLPMSAYTEGEDIKVEFNDGNYIELIWPVHLYEKQAITIKDNYSRIKEVAYQRDPPDENSN